MTQEEKHLLLVDLCARLPYGVKVQDELGRVNKLVIGNADLIRLFYNDFSIYGENALSFPLLRPMSSMTEGEKKELEELRFLYSDGHIATGYQSKDEPVFVDEVHCITIIDWLNSHHFDYRGLIEKGLALEAPKDMCKV